MFKKTIFSFFTLSVLSGCAFTGIIEPLPLNDNKESSSSTKEKSEQTSNLKNLPVKEVQAIPETLVINEGNKIKATASVIYGDNSRSSDLIWSSSDNTLASVNATTGEISAIKPGVVTIIATAQTDSTKKSAITVTVKKADVLEAITRIEPKEATLKIGETVRLNASVQMSDGSVSPNVTWSTDNQAIALVTNGLVTGITEGTVNITATADGDSTKKVSAKITVTK